MSQQINLFNEVLHQSGKEFSVRQMMQGLVLVLIAAMFFYAYTVYQTEQTGTQLEETKASLSKEQTRLSGLSAEFLRQRSGMTLEQELKKLSAEAAAQRVIISALKRGVIGNTRGYSAYMEAFARQGLSGLWLTGFSIDGDATQMSISGAALSPELVPAYIMRLNNEAAMRGKSFASLQMQLPKAAEDKPPTAPYLEFVLQSVAAGDTKSGGAEK